MKRWTIGMAALAVTACLAAAQPAKAGTSVGVHIQIGDPYHGGSLVFHKEPDLVLVPRTRVYHVRDIDYDLYRYGSYWYLIDDGYWYRARSYRGPFIHITTSSVPRSIRGVPVKYRRHWKSGPPPHAVAHGYYKDRDRHPGHKHGKGERGYKREHHKREHHGRDHGNDRGRRN